jgi:hypothetical protein
MDHHVPAAITEGLRTRGVDVLTALEDGTEEFEDSPLLERAGELDRVLFTQDTDLLAVANQWNLNGKQFVGLFFGHQLQLTVGQAVRDLELAAKVLEPQDVRNLVEYLPL